MEEQFDIRDYKPTGKKSVIFENALRPLQFEDFSGQDKVVDNLRIFVKAARLRAEALDHVLLHGPPGLGKTTLSNIIANELGVGFKVTSGPVLDKPGDLAGVLTSLEPNDVLFIDEIHRLSPVVEEYLYSAMEDYRIDIMIDKGPSARSIQIDLNPFTLVGATTRSGLLTAPLRARFGINLHLEYYDDSVLSRIILRSARILDVPCDADAAGEIASRSRGTPRIANALLRRVRDFAQVKGSGRIDLEIARFALEALNIDQYGLDEIDNKILCTIIDKFKGGPVGLTTIATALGEDPGTLEEVYRKVERDLLEGVELISDDGYSVPKYHFTRKAAYAFAARFYLYYMKPDFSNCDRVIDFATRVLGSNPDDLLRDWEALSNLSVNGNVQADAYIASSNEANLLISSTVSNWGALGSDYLVGPRYFHNQTLATSETCLSAGLVGQLGLFVSETFLYHRICSQHPAQERTL